MKLARYLGICVQALVLGTLLFLAITRLISLATGAQVFVYQGY